MTAAGGRARVSSGSPFEASIGFARALRVDDRIIVSGTAPVEDDGMTTPGDAGAQAARCLDLVIAAIAALGGGVADVIRTRLYLVDAADAGAVGAAHAARFGAARPAATMVVVAGLLRPEWRVEIEAEAMLGATP